ncbi:MULTISPECIES: hypothetical protein [Acidiphilium]|uniref:hypothetical protein n=1 Tax=Acidiphilium TaxID=522 RepID=UPI0011156053|nr:MULTISPECIES: hypothetical protein [Acidiphilium]
MKRFWLAAFISLFLTVSTKSQNTPYFAPIIHRPIASIGVGMDSCGRYAEVYKQYGESGKDTFLEWAFGYLTANNAAQARDNENQLQVKKNTIIRSIDRYCNEHPLATFSNAVTSTLNWYLANNSASLPAQKSYRTSHPYGP